VCGSLGSASKMPCHTYGLSAFECRTGGLLAAIPGSVCSKCYAHRGNYLFPGVINAHAVRLAAIRADLDAWTLDMIDLIRAEEHTGYFRWHDSGDVQSPEHLHAIVLIARELPHIKFWLPTKEYDWIREYPGKFPANLIVRVSHPTIGKSFFSGFPRDNGEVVGTSSVGSLNGWKCPAPKQGGKCGMCRACWDINVLNVDYERH